MDATEKRAVLKRVVRNASGKAPVTSGALRQVLGTLSTKGGYVQTIRAAGKNGSKVSIDYLRKKDGKVGTYSIEPYSERGNKLYGFKTNASGKTGTGIRSFIKARIVGATPLSRKYTPRWDVEF